MSEFDRIIPVSSVSGYSPNEIKFSKTGDQNQKRHSQNDEETPSHDLLELHEEAVELNVKEDDLNLSNDLVPISINPLKLLDSQLDISA